MPRSTGQDGKQTRLRAQLEAVLLDIVDGEEVSPLIQLRIEQAIRRAGLDDLLGPAIEDLDRLRQDLCTAKSKVVAAVGTLRSE